VEGWRGVSDIRGPSRKRSLPNTDRQTTPGEHCEAKVIDSRRILLLQSATLHRVWPRVASPPGWYEQAAAVQLSFRRPNQDAEDERRL
jgi:hypothetical protein